MKHVGVLTGKGFGWGGSLIRPEATGYGLVYITQYAMEDIGTSFKGKRVAVSGAGNVATFCTEKVMELGGTVISLSDRYFYANSPYLYCMKPHIYNGMTTMQRRMRDRGKRIHEGAVPADP